MWGELLQGLGAAGEGALDGYTWGKQYEQRNREIDQRGEIARLQGEIRAMVAGMTEAGRNERHATPSASVVAQQEGATARTDATNMTRTNITEMLEGGRDRRHATPSGSTVAAQEGATERTGMNISARDMWNRMSDTTRRRGQDISQGTAEMRDETQRRGQDFGLGATVLRDGTARRGQDMRTAPGARGGGLPSPDEAGLEAPAAPAAPAPDRAALAGQIRAALDAVKAAKTPAEKASALQRLKDLRAQVP
jgi:hypothetical protein